MGAMIENGLLLLDLLETHGHGLPSALPLQELKSLSGLSEHDFRDADGYLRMQKYVGGPWVSGTPEIRLLQIAGKVFLDQERAKQYPLSIESRKLACYILEQHSSDQSVVRLPQACAELGITEQQYVAAAHELADFELLVDRTQIQEKGKVFIFISLTQRGRQVVRENFRREQPIVQQQVGAIFQGPVNATNIQAIAEAYKSDISQSTSMVEPEQLRTAIQETVEKLVALIGPQLDEHQREVYERAAKDVIAEARQEIPRSSALHRSIRILGFMADVEGTMTLAERGLQLAAQAGPYLAFLLQMATRLSGG